jgi:lycopene cyclase domain-containing protein
MKYTYLLINFFTIIIPLIYSFHARIRFDRFFRAFFISVFLASIPFLIWDAIFTAQGVWGFNEKYLTGISLYKLPLEEILFFFCIPFACVFTYHSLTKFFNLTWSFKRVKIFSLVFSGLLFVLGILFFDRAYTMVTFISTALLVAVAVWLLKIDWFGKAVTVYGVLLIPFLIVNGLLTGTGLEQPVVFYNDSENLGIRILTIPIEDTVYGFELFFLTLLFYHRIKKERSTELHHLSDTSRDHSRAELVEAD